MKDTAYLALSARIRAMENQLLTPGRMEQILQAGDDQEVERILTECGYPAFDVTSAGAMDAAIRSARKELFDELQELPNQALAEIFRIKYDYHNLKALLKGGFEDVKHILVDQGRVDGSLLAEGLREGGSLPGRLAEAAEEGREVLHTTRDPQLMEIVLDRWYYRELLETAEKAQSDFLLGYVRLVIDSANLRALVRSLRMGKSSQFLAPVLVEGGEIPTEEILAVSAEGGTGLAERWASTPLGQAAESGAEALKGGALTEFEKRCDDAVSAYLSDARFIPFGEEPVLAYLAAREAEFTNLRILLLGRSMGLEGSVIRSRLRESYV